jgi:hypothetical protein
MKTVKSRLVWEKSDIDYLVENYDKKVLDDLSEHLGVSIGIVKAKGDELGLSRNIRTVKKVWTNDEIEYLRQNFSTKPVCDLCDRLPYSQPTISKMARKLGLRKIEGYRRGKYTGRYIRKYKSKQNGKTDNS